MTEKNTAELANSEEKQRWRISRRRFLIGAGLAGGGLALGYLFGVPATRLRIAESTDERGGGFFSQSNEPLAWFEVKPDSSITLYVPKVEMGQGVHTALKQIAVEEHPVLVRVVAIAVTVDVIERVDTIHRRAVDRPVGADRQPGATDERERSCELVVPVGRLTAVVVGNAQRHRVDAVSSIGVLRILLSGGRTVVKIPIPGINRAIRAGARVREGHRELLR